MREALLKRHSNTGVFLWKNCDIAKFLWKPIFEERLRTAATDVHKSLKSDNYLYNCTENKVFH